MTVQEGQKFYGVKIASDRNFEKDGVYEITVIQVDKDIAQVETTTGEHLMPLSIWQVPIDDLPGLFHATYNEALEAGRRKLREMIEDLRARCDELA